MWHLPSVLLYLFAFLLTGFFANKYDSKSQKENIIFLILALLPNYLLLAMRGEDMGTDLPRYFIHVDYTSYIGLTSLIQFTTEPFYTILYSLSNYFNDSHGAFLWLSATLQYLLLFFSLREFRKNNFNITVILLMFTAVVVFRSYSMIRNGAAIAASLGAFAQLSNMDKQGKLKFWMFTLLGFGCHNATILNIPIYFMFSDYQEDKLKRNNIKAILILLGVLFVAFFVRDYLDLFLMEFDEERYSGYLTEDNGFGLGNTIVRLPLLLITALLYRDLKNEYGVKAPVYLYFLLFDLVIAQLRYLSSNLERLTMATGMSEAIMLSLLLPILRRKYGTVAVCAVYTYSVFCLYRAFYQWEILGNYGLMPYHFR